jgi:hypothetical protein
MMATAPTDDRHAASEGERTMIDTAADRGRTIIAHIEREAMRLEQEGHGLDYTCLVSEPHFDAVLAALGERAYLASAARLGETRRALVFTVRGAYGICLISDERERAIELMPGSQCLDWTVP